MKIKTIHAHFLISSGDYCNERIGFSVELEADETVESVVAELRAKAIEAIGKKAREIYDEKWEAQKELREITKRLHQARDEWNKTADFLRAQGIKPDASPMPQFSFSNLLTGRVEEESVTAEMVDEEDRF